MKNILRLLFIFSLFTLSAKAQNYTSPSLTQEIHPGTVTPLDGKIIQGYVLNASNVKNQKECIFYLDYKDGRSRKVYSPDDLLGYTVEDNAYKSLSYSGNLKFGKASKHFVYVAKPGSITTYVYWGPEEQLLWAKENEEPVGSASLLMGFKKNILKLTGDDADIAGKIEQKEKGYGMMNVADIIAEYNTRAAAKK